MKKLVQTIKAFFKKIWSIIDKYIILDIQNNNIIN